MIPSYCWLSSYQIKCVCGSAFSPCWRHVVWIYPTARAFKARTVGLRGLIRSVSSATAMPLGPAATLRQALRRGASTAADRVFLRLEILNFHLGLWFCAHLSGFLFSVWFGFLLSGPLRTFGCSAGRTEHNPASAAFYIPLRKQVIQPNRSRLATHAPRGARLDLTRFFLFRVHAIPLADAIPRMSRGLHPTQNRISIHLITFS